MARSQRREPSKGETRKLKERHDEKNDSLTEGARRFTQFLETHGIRQRQAADALGVSGPAIHEWQHGTRRPKPHLRDAIEIWTSGFVKKDMWEREGEEEQKHAVVPFVPKKVEKPTGT